MQKAIKERREKVRPVLEPQLREQAQRDLKARVRQQQERLAYLLGLEKRLNEDVERLDKDSRSMAKQGVDLESIREEISQADEVMKKVGAQAEALTVERTARPRIKPLEEGNSSQPDQQTRRLLGAVGGGLGTLVLVVFGFSWFECRSLRVNSADEVVLGLGLQVMGTLPLLPSRSRWRRVGAAGQPDWEHLLRESVDSMRTLLLHMARASSLRVIMVSSALGGEGKTSLSGHLATSLSRAGRKTLLLDGDFRKPSLHRVFDLPVGPGFCELLRGEAVLEDVIRETMVDGLFLVPAGKIDPVALSALAQGRAAAVFDQLRQRYDFVILDSAPVLPVTDSLLLAQDVDGVLLSILRDVSQLARVYAAYERLALLGVRMLGAVVTGTPQAYLYGQAYRYLGQADPVESPEAPLTEEAS